MMIFVQNQGMRKIRPSSFSSLIKQGAEQFLVIFAMGAVSNSKVFYNRTKEEILYKSESE